MSQKWLPLPALILLCAVVSGCSGGSSSNNPPPVGNDPPLVNDPPPGPPAISVSRSGSTPLAVTIGGSQAVAITFTSADARELAEIVLTDGLSTLPAGWSGPSTFSCQSVTSGSACVLTLTYAPAAPAEGTFTLSYRYGALGGTQPTGTLTIPFESTANNNVAATATPTGQIIGVVGEDARTVNVAFNTDDGHPARNLQLTTSLTNLPAGWSSAVNSFACAQVSTGNGCLLQLEFEPTAVHSAAFMLTFSYEDNSGADKTGELEVRYAAQTHNTVSATPSQALPFTTAIGTQRTLTVTFNSNDGHPAQRVFLITEADSLPAGWSTTQTDFECRDVAAGNGCQLQLQYAPGASASSHFLLQYGFIDNAGRADSATLAVGYAALTHNAVVGEPTVTPVQAAVGTPVNLIAQFRTDDGNTATNFAVDTDLDALPTGWDASVSDLTCASVHTGPHCYLSLTYSPVSAGTGTLALSYSYTNNAGDAQTGTLNIPYTALANNAVVATAPTVETRRGHNMSVPLTFKSNDANPITGFTVTSSLTSNARFTGGPASFNCATVTNDNSCAVTLSYSSLAEESGSFTVDYSYVNHAGATRTGSLVIPYATYGARLFVGTYDNGIFRCVLTSDWEIDTCQHETAGDFLTVGGFNFRYGNDVVQLADRAGQLLNCQVGVSGVMSNCQSIAPIAGSADHLTKEGGWVIVSGLSYSSGITTCPVSNDGVLTGSCVSHHALSATGGIYADVGYIFATRNMANQVDKCLHNYTTGVLTCGASGATNLSGPVDIAQFGDKMLIANGADGSVTRCNWDYMTDTLNTCVKQNMGFSALRSITTFGLKAYIAANTNVFECDVDGATAVLSNCVVKLNAGSPRQIAVR